MKSILVPVDFSECSMNAVDYAGNLATAVGARINLIHTYTCPTSAAVMINLNEIVRKEAQKKMTDLVAKMKKDFPEIQIEGGVSAGYLELSAREISNQFNSDLIIMGTKGKTTLQSKIIGTMTQKILENVDTPLLVVPQTFDYLQVKSICISAMKLDKFPSKLNEVLSNLILAFDSEITILNLQDDIKDVDSGAAMKQALDLKESTPGTSQTLKIRQKTNIAEDVEKELKDGNHDMLAMIATRKNLLQSLFSTSQTMKMTGRTQLPLLIVKEEE